MVHIVLDVHEYDLSIEMQILKHNIRKYVIVKIATTITVALTSASTLNFKR